MPPKKVAIIGEFPYTPRESSPVVFGSPLTSSTPGAGPSGLVTAKTLLHNFPREAFSPIIFDSQCKVGGLWTSEYLDSSQANGPSLTLDPRMRTNLSRFTVAFSDLAWESVLPNAEIPLFPQARQVGQYLAHYTDRYIPNEILRLGCRVVQTTRKVQDGLDPKWNVQWTRERYVVTAVFEWNVSLQLCLARGSLSPNVI